MGTLTDQGAGAPGVVISAIKPGWDLDECWMEGDDPFKLEHPARLYMPSR